jgi:uncharacterized repeat protein (TIGR01451 family)
LTNNIIVTHHLEPDIIWTLGSGRVLCESDVTLFIEGVGDPIPVEVVLAIDYSSSMNDIDPNRTRLIAAKTFVGGANSSRDKIGLVLWNDKIIESVNLTNDFEYINYTINAMDEIKSYNGTYYDIALNKSIDILENDSKNVRKCIIFLSDGKPKLPYIYHRRPYTNTTDANSPVVRANKQGIEIWTIGYIMADGSEGQMILKNMSDFTGGRYNYADNFSINRIFLEIYKNITKLAGKNVTVRYLAPKDLIYSIPHDSIEGPNKVFTWNAGDIFIGEDPWYKTFKVSSEKTGQFILGKNPWSVVNYTMYNGTSRDLAIEERVLLVINTSVDVNKTATPKIGSPSTKITFVINVTNTGDVDLDQLIVRDELPYGLKYVEDDQATRTLEYNMISWNLSDLKVSESKFVELVAQVDGSKFGTLNNKVEVLGKPLQGGNVSANDTEEVFVPGLVVEKYIIPTKEDNSTDVGFGIKVTNIADADLDPLIVCDELPDGLEFVSDNQQIRTFYGNSNMITWNLGPLNVSESNFVEFIAKIDGSQFGTVTNKADVTGTLPNGSNITGNDSLSLYITPCPESGCVNTSFINYGDIYFNLNGTYINKSIYNNCSAPTDPDGQPCENLVCVCVDPTCPKCAEVVGHNGSKINNINIVQTTIFGSTPFWNGTGDTVGVINLTVSRPEAAIDAVFAFDVSGSMRLPYEGMGEESMAAFVEADFSNVSIVGWDEEDGEGADRLMTPPRPLVESEVEVLAALANLSGRCGETDQTVYSAGLREVLEVDDRFGDLMNGDEKIILFVTGPEEFRPGEGLDGLATELKRRGYAIYSVGVEIDGIESPLKYESLSTMASITGGRFYPIGGLGSDELREVLWDAAAHASSRAAPKDIVVTETLPAHQEVKETVPSGAEVNVAKNPDGTTTLTWTAGGVRPGEARSLIILTAVKGALPPEGKGTVAWPGGINVTATGGSVVGGNVINMQTENGDVKIGEIS